MKERDLRVSKCNELKEKKGLLMIILAPVAIQYAALAKLEHYEYGFKSSNLTLKSFVYSTYG